MYIEGEEAITTSTYAGFRYPSLINHINDGQNCWAPVSDKIKKIHIKSGITSIREKEFRFFYNLEEVIIEDGMKKIGKEAFAYCENLKKVNTPLNSCAYKYAEKNRIRVYTLDTNTNKSVKKLQITGLKTKYSYTGERITPAVIVKDNKKKLVKGKDYKLLYKYNINIGQGVLVIKGLNKYERTLKKTFYIVPKRNEITKIKSKAGSISVTWKKNSMAEGYLVQISNDKNFKKNKQTFDIKDNSVISKKITNLKRNKKYYVRVCSYMKKLNKRYYGKNSKVIPIK